MRDIRPKITVITPTYNRAGFIKKTIESILAQDYQDFEYLILDDGSNDNTKEVVKPFLKDKRVKYLYHQNQGEAETVNWGWQLAKGEYFTQVNSDDLVSSKLFNEMLQILEKNENYVVAYPNFNFINEKGQRIKEKLPKIGTF
jgi:glycosyltransferase involved in cell wall biosynthesis